MKKRYIILIALVVFALGGLAEHILAESDFGTLPPFRQLCYSTGHILFSEGGDAILVNNEPIIMSDASKSKALFDGIKKGERVLVIHGLVMTTYPAQSSAYLVIKLPNNEQINQQTVERLIEMGWIEEK